LSKTKFKVSQLSKPRFEFRTFGSDFRLEHKKLADLSEDVQEKVKERNSDEIYIIAKNNNRNNTKIRNGKMDIKILIHEKDGLEQWSPKLKTKFPLTFEFIKDDLFPAFKTTFPNVKQKQYNIDEFLGMVKDQKDIQAVTVKKHRFGYFVNNTICEFAEVIINGTQIYTISSESTVISDIKKTLSDVGLTGRDNINYIKAIKRVIKMNNKY